MVKFSRRHLLQGAGAALAAIGLHHWRFGSFRNASKVVAHDIPTFDLPGFLTEFPEDPLKEHLMRSRWTEQLDLWLRRAIGNDPWNFTHQPNLTNYYHPFLTDIPEGAPAVPITWTTFPNRIKFEFPNVGRRKQWEYADNSPYELNPDYYPPGARGWQDEYAEWSVTRNAQGKITQVMFTSETREYWYGLWDVDPQAVLNHYRELISPDVQLEDLYRRDESGRAIVDPQTGRPAYNDLNKWNTKTENGLAHMIAEFNFLMGAVFLVGQSTILRKDKDGNPVTDPNELINCVLAGTGNRNSDPFIGAYINDLVRGPKGLGSGVRVSFKNPPGLYLQSPNFALYQLPANAPANAKPSDFWKAKRGRLRRPGESYDLTVNAVYEVPPELGFTVSDITINGFPIEYGSQIAETVNVAVIGEGIPQDAPPLPVLCSRDDNPKPYPDALREGDLIGIMERSYFKMKIEQGSTVENVALKARHSDRGATIEFVDAPGLTVRQTGFQDEGNDRQIFFLTITASANTPLGDHSLLLKNSDGSGGPPRFGMIEVVKQGSLG